MIISRCLRSPKGSEKRIALTLALAAGYPLAFPDCAYACECAPPLPPEEAFAQATAVFSGEVIDVQRPTSPSSPDPLRITFRVFEVWKGPAYDHLIIRTGPNTAICGYPFREGDQYLVYAKGGEDDLSTGLCSRTRLLATADEDLAVLGGGITALLPNPALGQPARPPLALGLAALAFLAALLAFLLLRGESA